MRLDRSTFLKLAAAGATAAALLLGATGAQAQEYQPQDYQGNQAYGQPYGNGYAPAPAYGQPAYGQPLYGQPAPQYYQPAPQYYQAPPSYYAPAPIYYAPGWRGPRPAYYNRGWDRGGRGGWDHGRGGDHRGHR
jgi:hypothetical protein